MMMRATVVALLTLLSQSAVVAASSKGSSQSPLQVTQDAIHQAEVTWPQHSSGGICSKGYVGGLKVSSQNECQTACDSTNECQFYCHGLVGKQWECVHYASCPETNAVLKNWSMSDYNCYRRPPLASPFLHPASRSAAPGAGGVVTTLRVPHHLTQAQPPIDLPTIKTYILKIDDVCDQVDEALGVANVTLYNLTDMMAPLVDGALDMLDKAKIASEAADMFGASGMAAWITQFSEKMSAKVVDFQTKMSDAALAMLDQLNKAHEQFVQIRANVLDKFGTAFAQLESIVEVIVKAVKGVNTAVAAVGGNNNNFMARGLTETSLLQAHVNSSLHRTALTLSRTDIALARAKVRRGEVGAQLLFQLNGETIDSVKAALAQAKTSLEPLAAALSQLSDMIADGLVGQVLNQVEDGVGKLNQTAYDAVETAGSVLPGVLKGQMQGMFNGALNMVDKVSAQITGVVEEITGKIDMANETEAKLDEAIEMMTSLVDSVAPIFSSSLAAKLPSCGAALLLAFAVALGSSF